MRWRCGLPGASGVAPALPGNRPGNWPGPMRGSFQRHIHGNQTGPVKPAIDVHEIDVRPAHRDRSRQKNHSQHDLRRDQRFANQPRTTPAAGSAGSERVGAAGVERREDAEKQPAEKRCRNRKTQHPAIQNGIRLCCQGSGLKPGGDGRGPEGDEESGDGGRQREQHAFGQQLLREPAPGWLSGRTVWKARWHGPRSAVRGPRHRQVRDVGASVLPNSSWRVTCFMGRASG